MRGKNHIVRSRKEGVRTGGCRRCLFFFVGVSLVFKLKNRRKYNSTFLEKKGGRRANVRSSKAFCLKRGRKLHRPGKKRENFPTSIFQKKKAPSACCNKARGREGDCLKNPNWKKGRQGKRGQDLNLIGPKGK